MGGGRRKRKAVNHHENDMHALIDGEIFRAFQAKILASLKEDLMNGMKAEDIFKKYEPQAAAALVSALLDPKNVVTASEKILDRTQGKAVQKVDSTHRLEKLKDSELDSFLTSRLKELTGADDSDDDKVQ